MTTPSEQWIVNELRHATDRLPLPPESRWVREPRSGASLLTIATVSAAMILVIAVIGAITALRDAPRVVPAFAADAFVLRENSEWGLAQSMLPPGLAVLRPTWIPAQFRGSAECPSPWTSLDSLGPGYTVRYQSDRLPNGKCALLTFAGVSQIVSYAGNSDGLEDTGTVDVRGTTVHVRSGTPRAGIGSPAPTYQINLWWNESGATYQVMSNALEIGDLVLVLRSLEPMR